MSDPDQFPPALGRREWLKRAAAVPAAGLVLSPAAVEAAHEHAQAKLRAAGAKEQAAAPRFFSAPEWRTVRLLADLVIPADERSGSATEAGVPEFIDFILTDPLAEAREREALQTQLRGGLRWLDHACQERFGRPFAGCSPEEQAALLETIAWPERVPPGSEVGAAFFGTFRDLVASGFWSSRLGVEDLGYTGNTFVAEWKGCPAEVLAKLGL